MSGGHQQEAGASVNLEFSVSESDDLEIFDPIERHNLSFETGRAVDPTRVDTAPFTAPVDAAVAVRPGHLRLRNHRGLYVRDDDWNTVARVSESERIELDPGTYSIEFPSTIKLYLRVEGALAVAIDEDGTRLEFDADAEVLLGARSRHESPAATITTTGEPRDTMRAVSHLGTALKTTSPERSFPSLRGHPPLLELADRLSIPAELERPDTGIRIEVPETLDAVVVVAPLAYYLGAEVVPGPEPRLVVGPERSYSLYGPAGFEERVARTLKQLFLLDCVTRTEGLYDFDLHERNAVETDVSLPFSELYERPVHERTAAYLDVPYESVEAHLPEWNMTTRVAAEPDSVELLPFLVDDLAIVRTPSDPEPAPTASAEAAAIDEFVRDGSFTRSTDGGPSADTAAEPASPADESWVGGDAPGSVESLHTAFRNRLDREPAEDTIEIIVVCNDSEMDDERTIVEDAYGSREDLPFDVTIHRNLTAAAFRDVLAESADFLHYIGHIDDAGFDCLDGKCDAADLGEMGVDAFFLNACRSYRQGEALIEAGSIGGVVTRYDVVNSGAVDVGSTLARLLNGGFPLREGLKIASDESVIGGQYSVIGDGSLAITQPTGGVPTMFEVDRVDEGFRLVLRGFPTTHAGMGAILKPYLEGEDTHYLNSGEVQEYLLTVEELLEFVSMENDVPVEFEGELFWSQLVDRSTFD
jgi:hypothetical protein